MNENQIEFEREKHPDSEIFSRLNPLVGEWFKKKFGSFSEPQRYAVLNIHSRMNTLISAPTGSGKTFAAFASILSELITLSEHNQLEDKVYCVYVSPLRALSNDIEKNLNEPLEEITALAEKMGKKIMVRVATRTGDTLAGERQKMLRKPPHILITTPETLAIVLNAPKFSEKLADAKWVIVDEIHSMASGKRGVHLSLSLERLQRHATELTRIGLSATISPLTEIAEFLVGLENGKPRQCRIVDVQFLKKLDLKVISPLPDLVNATSVQLQKSLYALLDSLIQEHKTTLIFTNTRSATERVVHNLKELFPAAYLEGDVGAHHSSLSREHRLNIENRLKAGELKVVVTSTSLELGIDIGYIDLVILLGSPKSVARALQRVGRSGHKLHDKVKGRIIVLDRDDLVECSVILKDAIDGKIDGIHVPENCLDVLSQHVFGLSLEERMEDEKMLSLIRQSYCYRNLSKAAFFEVVDYLAGTYTSLETRHVYAKIWHDPVTKMIGKRGKMGRIIYMTNIGTIPDEARVKVKCGNDVIGSIDEIFLEHLKKSDVFVLGGQTYEFIFAVGMTANVKPAYKRPPTVPSWFSEMLPLNFDLANDIQKFRDLMEEKFRKKRSKAEIIEFILKYLYVDGNAGSALYEYFRQQFSYSQIPVSGNLLVEQIKEGGKNHLIFHSLCGRRANDALSMGIAYIISRIAHKDIQISINDNGFTITSDSEVPLEHAIATLNCREFRQNLESALQRTEMFNRRFRHCATRALMILRSYKGRTKSAGRQQMSSRLLLGAVQRLDQNFCIIREAKREILEDAMDISNALKVVRAIENNEMKLKVIQLKLPSPFAINLFVQGYSDVLRMEDRLEFIKRLNEKIMASAGTKTQGKAGKNVDYGKVWETIDAERKTARDDPKRKLRQMAWNLKHVPLNAKEEIINLIDNDSGLSARLAKNVLKYKDEIAKEWPKELSALVLKAAEKAVEESGE